MSNNKYNIQPKIIKGYKGVMELDLTNVNIIFHKELIKQHYKDIELYKKEQENLKDELKYDNGIGLSLTKMELHNKIIANRFKILKNQ